MREPNPGWQGEGTVLIADDEESVCRIGKMVLERLGFEVITAMDGLEAVNLFREHADRINCVLLDLAMPRLEGSRVFDEIQRIKPGVKVILCSGYGADESVQQFAGKGIAGFLQKPYRFADLQEKFREVFQGDQFKT